MQYFEWYLKTNQDFWLKISNQAEKISELGITAVWLPPAYKGVGGKDEVGANTGTTLTIRYTYHNNENDNIGLGDLIVTSDAGLAITGVSITD